MADKDLKLALKIEADMAQAKAELEALDAVLVELGDDAANTGKKTTEFQSEINKTTENILPAVNATEAFREEVEALQIDVEKAGQSLIDIADGFDDVNNALKNDELDSFSESLDDLDNSTASVGSGADSLRDSARALMVDLKAYEETLGRTSLSAEELYAQEQRLDRLMASGAISAKEYEDALKHLDKAEGSLTKEHDAQAKALQKLLRETDSTAAALKKLDENAEQLKAEFDAGRISAEQYDRALSNIGNERNRLETLDSEMGRLGLTTQEARNQMLTFLKQLATGEFDDAAMSLFRLSQRAQGGSLAFARFAIPILAATGALAAFAAISYAAWQDQQELEKAIILTGNAAGITDQVFSDLARSIEQSSSATIGQSRDIALQLVSIGNYSAETLQVIGQGAALMQELTGQTAEEVLKDFERIESGVAKWAAAHNNVLNFLTVADYNRIRAMEENGDKEAAILIAMEALQKSKAKMVVDSVGDIEKAWIDGTKAVSEYWEMVKLAFKGGDEANLEELKRKIASRTKTDIKMGRDPDDDDVIIRWKQEVQHLEQIAEDERKAAADAGREARADKEAIRATERIAEASLRADRERQMKNELDKLARDFEAGTAGGRNKGNADFSEANRKKLEDEIRKKYSDKSAVSKAASEAKAAEDYVKKLEQEAEAIGKTAAEVRLLASEQHKLTDEQQMRVNGALIQINAEKELQEAKKYNLKLDEVRLKILKSNGKEAEAAAAEVAKQTAALRDEALRKGDVAGVDLIDRLIDIEKLKGRLGEAQTAIEKTLTDLQRAEQSINVQREAGLISEYEARQRILELHKATYAELDKQRPLLEELAKQPGAVGEAAAKALADLNAQSERLQATTSLLANTIKQGLEGGLEDAIVGLADGTKSFGDAVRSVGQAVAQALAQMAAQAMAQGITGAIMGAAGGGGNNAGGWLSTIASFFADGGHVRGPGTGTSDSIPAMLSNNEFVTRAAVVAQPNALNFLDDFNTRGMLALRDWAPAYHNTGGLAGVPAPSMPAPSMPASFMDPSVDQGANSGGVTNRIVNVVDPTLVEDYLHSASGDKVFVNWLTRNTTLVQRIAGGRS